MPKERKRTAPRFGAIVISLDFELLWGVRDTISKEHPYASNILGARQAIPLLLDLFQEFNVAATWATVGLLLAENREEQLEFWPSDRPSYLDPRLDPRQESVGADESHDPYHFAPTLVRQIHQTPRQELGTHTYTHYYCREAGQTAEDFRADVQAALDIARRKGYVIRSLVFPRNQTDYLALLFQLGFHAYRGEASTWGYASVPRWQVPLQRLYRFVDAFLPLSGDNTIEWSSILDDYGMCNLRASRFLRIPPPAARVLAIERIRWSLRKAATEKKLFHLWWHPHNFGRNTNYCIDCLREILEEFSLLSSNFDFRSMTMLEAAQAVREGQVE